MKKKDVTKGLDPDLFESGLEDDEADNEEEVGEEILEEAAEQPEEDPVEELPPSKESEPEPEVAEEEETTVVEEDSSETPEIDSNAGEVAEVEESVEEAPVEEVEEEDPAEEVEEDADDETDTYTVQRGFTSGGKTFHPGDVIPVKCKHCALWKREWLGKVRCSPGRRLDEDTVMNADRFSCANFFICKEYSPELSTFLSMSLPEILMVRKMIPGIKKILQAPDFLANWVEKQNYSEDVGNVFTNAKGFVLSFNSEEQLLYAEEFLRNYANIMTQRSRTKRPPKPKFEPGDWVTWHELESKEKVAGIILSIGRGNIYLAGAYEHKGQKYTYKYKEWKAKYSPAITRKTADTA